MDKARKMLDQFWQEQFKGRDVVLNGPVPIKDFFEILSVAKSLKVAS